MNLIPKGTVLYEGDEVFRLLEDSKPHGCPRIEVIDPGFTSYKPGDTRYKTIYPIQRANYSWAQKQTAIRREFWKNRLIEFYNALLRLDEKKIDKLLIRMVADAYQDAEFLYVVTKAEWVLTFGLVQILNSLIPCGVNFLVVTSLDGKMEARITELRDTRVLKNRLFALCYGASLERVFRCN